MAYSMCGVVDFFLLEVLPQGGFPIRRCGLLTFEVLFLPLPLSLTPSLPPCVASVRMCWLIVGSMLSAWCIVLRDCLTPRP